MRQGWRNGTVEEHRVTLPGTTQTNDIGPPCRVRRIGNLNPNTEHVGPAWYWRDLDLSEDDCRRHVALLLERVCWQSFAWLNGEPLGTQDSLVSPHRYDLGMAARPGRNRLTLMVDNSNLKTDAGDRAGRMAEAEELIMEGSAARRLHCGGHHASFGGLPWNGITGRIELQIRPLVRITAPQVHPDLDNKCALVKCVAINETGTDVQCRLVLEVEDRRVGQDLAIGPGRQALSLHVDLGEGLRLWDEHTPELYGLHLRLESDHGTDQHRTVFGMRALSVLDNQVAINGRKRFLRGALEKFVHPLTGYPPTDLESWLKIFRVHKAHGLNHLRFHSCCPPEAGFAAADRLGIVLDIELPGASGGETTDEPTQTYLQDEALRILDEFGNHPSFCMLTMGNEVLSDEVAEADGQARLMQRVARCREHDPRRWYCCTAHAYTPGRDDDFYVTAWPNGPTMEARHQGEPLRGFRWNGGDVVDDSRFNTRAPETAGDYRQGIAGIDRPVITHEVGMWAVYPDISEIPTFNGVLKPFNLELIRDFMQEKGTLGLADDFVKASGELSLILYKEEIEAALRTPGLSGFQLLGIHDHPPQGTSTIGVVTALRESKGLIEPAGFRQFCSEIVPLARLPKRTYTSGEVMEATLDVAQYGAADLPDATCCWSLASDTGEARVEGRFDAMVIPCGTTTRVGRLSVDLASFPVPSKLRLEVWLAGSSVRNGWDCWVYPDAPADEPEAIIRHGRWSAEVAASIEAGQTVLLELGREEIPQATRGCFTTLLWNPIMKRKHLSQTMGVLCDPSHPALARFPTEFHSNWQWWDVLQPSLVLNLDGMAPRPDPIIRMVDSFIGNRCLSPLFEARLGKGRLIVTSLDLSSRLGERHAARQLRQSVLAYAASDAFRPSVATTAAEIARLIEAHQHAVPVPSRAEVEARFDRPARSDAMGF